MHGSMNEAVVATKIGFTRTVDGVAVLGAGSKIGITFDTKRQVLAFDIDWPQYTHLAGKGLKASEGTVDLATVRQRAKKVRNSRKLEKQVEELSFECGYFDSGTLAGAGAGVRGACQSRYRTSSADGHRSAGVIDTIPIAEQVVDDSSWPESALLRQ
jgi:hypothetical protein